MKLAEDLRRSVLQATIEGKLTGGSREGWRWVRLGDIGEVIKRRNTRHIKPYSPSITRRTTPHRITSE